MQNNVSINVILTELDNLRQKAASCARMKSIEPIARMAYKRQAEALSAAILIIETVTGQKVQNVFR